MQNKIIGFCWCYLAGIVVSMLATPEGALLPGLRLITALLALGWFVAWVLRNRQPGRAKQMLRLEWAALVLTALALGLTRHTSANTIPDTRIGEIVLRAGEGDYLESRALPDVSRILLRIKEPPDGDLRFRLVGELDARLPIEENGVATMDDRGRWRFRLARVPQESTVLHISPEDAPGSVFVVPQPFSRITAIELLEGDADARLDVVRISNHAASFVRASRDSAPVTILGRILADPMVYDFKSVLTVTPAYIQYRAGGPFYRVEGGDLRVTVPPTVDNYPLFARTEAYGIDVQIRGSLFRAGSQANPGGFDQHRFMANHNLHGQMSLFQPRGEPAPIHAVAPADGELRRGHPLVQFSLGLRDRMLLVFKQVLPFPHSSFIGAVTLGLRYGLHGVESPFGEDRTIADEFRAAGVNHVLAVSGLHVTILTAMFMGIFTLLRIPRRMYAPLVILILVIFAIITGARPSTLRAVIMNSLFLLVWAYLSQGLRASALFGVPVAAFLILLHNPLMIVDPSFTLSFGAILSLALLTGPIHEQLSRLRGNSFAAALVIVTVFTLIGMLRWPLLTEPRTAIPLLLFAVLTVWLTRVLDRKGLLLVGRFGFADIPGPVSAFLSAQVAIQLGMMLPLSAYYFSQWAMAGAYANLLAIPLIGVVVQLGVIAGLFGLIPGIGLLLALVISAANWALSSLFLWIAYAGTQYFPFPFMRRPSLIELLIYYLLIAAFVWHRPLWKSVRRFCERRAWSHPAAPRALLACGLVVLLAPAAIFPAAPRPDGLNITVLSVGYGRSLVIETPGGRRVLVDAGFVEHERGRRNEAQRSILPFLAFRHLRDFEAVILTSPHPEESGGLPYILNEIKVPRLIVPPDLEGLRLDLSVPAFARLLGYETMPRGVPRERLQRMYEDLVRNPEVPQRPSLARTLALRRDTWINRWGRQTIRLETAEAGDILLEEVVRGRPFRIRALHPGDAHFEEERVANRSLVLRIEYGDFSMLIPGDLHYEGQRHLLAYTEPELLRADIALVPHHGAALPVRRRGGLRNSVMTELRDATAPLLHAVDPAVFIVDFGFPRAVLGHDSRDAEGVQAITEQFIEDRFPHAELLHTGRDLAIFIRSDGETFTVETQAERLRAHGGDEDAVTDMEIGF